MKGEGKMKVLVIGAGYTGSRVLRQLKKNPGIEVVTADPRDNPEAVKQKIIEAVDYKETLTPLTLEHIVKQAMPDLILWTSSTADMGLGYAPGIDMLTNALQDEVARISDVPLIEVSRTTVR